MMSFLPLYIYFIAISLLASCTVYTMKSPQYLRYFPPFLLATLIIEIIGSYYSSIAKNNIALYNFFGVFEFTFYLIMISMIIRNQAIKKLVLITTLLYVIGSVVNIVFLLKMKTFHTVTYAIGCLLVVAACVYFFFELFKLPKAVKLSNNPAFWICSGLLFFYCCGFPLFGMTNLISGISRMIIKNFSAIITILNVFLYSLFTIAFLCRLKIRKYTLSRS